MLTPSGKPSLTNNSQTRKKDPKTNGSQTFSKTSQLLAPFNGVYDLQRHLKEDKTHIGRMSRPMHIYRSSSSVYSVETEEDSSVPSCHLGVYGMVAYCLQRDLSADRPTGTDKYESSH